MFMNKTVHFLFLVLVTSSFAQNVTFDPAYGNNGHKQFSLGDKNTRGECMVVLPDDSFIISGETYLNLNGAQTQRSLFISRYDAQGNAMTDFGSNGTLSIANGPNGISRISAMQLQADGKIVLSGMINGTTMLMRISEQGQFDSSFGQDGIAYIASSGLIALQPDGKILVAGYHHDGYNTVYQFSRYHANGSVDLSFGNNGSLLTDLTPYRFDLPMAIKMQGNRPVLAGTSYDFGDKRFAVVSRFNADGSRDTTFGNNGAVVTPIGPAPGYAVFNDLVILPDNKILAAGNIEYTGGTGGYMGLKSTMVQFNNDGTPDNNFGTIGKVVLNPIFYGNDAFQALALQPDGKILGVGYSGHQYPNPQTHCNITRLNANGSLDGSFGTDGTVLTDNFNAETNGIRQAAILSGGKIFCMGYTRGATEEHFDVLSCRLKPNGALSVDENTADGLLLYPNPANDKLYIRGLQKKTSLTLYNVLGQTFPIGHPTIDEAETIVDLGRLAGGTYFLKIDSNPGLIVRKIVVE